MTSTHTLRRPAELADAGLAPSEHIATLERVAERYAVAITPAMAALGKQLYEVKYQCQSCHTIGGTGGYVGPNLNNAGGWLTAAWIEAWLRNPQALIPDTIEPRRNFTEDEVRALTAYLMTLRQNMKPQKTAGLTESRAASQGVGR